MGENEHRLPLGLCKQASLKLEAFGTDIYEILEDPDLTDEERAVFQTMREYAVTMMAQLINIVRKECGEDEFLAEQVPMDPVEAWPGDDSSDIIDQNL